MFVKSSVQVANIFANRISKELVGVLDFSSYEDVEAQSLMREADEDHNQTHGFG